MPTPAPTRPAKFRMVMAWVQLVITTASLAPASPPLEGRWRPEESPQVELDAGDDLLRLHLTAAATVRTDLLPATGARLRIQFDFAADAAPNGSVQFILQGLDQHFGGREFLTFDLPTPSERWQSFDRTADLGTDTRHVILRLRWTPSATTDPTAPFHLRLRGLRYADRVVLPTIAGGLIGTAVRIDPDADRRPITSVPTRLLPAQPVPWRNVFVGGAGTVRTIRVHPADGTVVAGADVSGPFYFDVHPFPTDNPPDTRTVPTYGLPEQPWVMADTGWRATMDAFGREAQGLIHTDQIAFDPHDPDTLYFVGGHQFLPGRVYVGTNGRGIFFADTQP